MSRLSQIAYKVGSPRHWSQAAELERLKRAPRYKPTKTRLLGPTIHTPDGPSLYSAYRAIFQQQVYAFEAQTDTPTVIDGGANIGLSVIYFKQRYPKARVIAYEPDPNIAAYCRRNLRAMGIKGVDLREAALWSGVGELEFRAEGADGGRIVDATDLSSCKVPTERLRDVIETAVGGVDLLKLDVEGAETVVLRDCRDVLGAVRRIFVEYHSFPDRSQTLAELLSILSNAGYRLHVTPENHAWQPFVARPLICGMDLQINVYAFRG